MSAGLAIGGLIGSGVVTATPDADGRNVVADFSARATCVS
jgi:hypothetical protein